ncbi:MAG: UTP20 family protein, partial [Proteobacteria bacterium]|nr:UTP20 family protein [Pseudomonadota bacterium]MBU1716110.1 UTP20 family protein [Pseudomonadota bacterium]
TGTGQMSTGAGGTGTGTGQMSTGAGGTGTGTGQMSTGAGGTGTGTGGLGTGAGGTGTGTGGLGTGAGGTGGMETGAGSGRISTPDFGPVHNTVRPDIATRSGGELDPENQRINPTVQEQYVAVSIAMPSLDRGLWNLSPQDQREMKRMVDEEENQEDTSDVIELLMIVLDKEEDPLSFATILGFFQEEFRNDMYLQEFQSALDLLTKISEFRNQCAKDWAKPLLNDYFDEISEPEILEVLLPVFADLSSFESKKLKIFSQVIRFLPPKAGESLAPMFSQIPSGPARQVLVDVIASFVKNDLNYLKKMLEERPEEDLLLRLIKILDGIDTTSATNILLEKGAHHTNDKVRLASLSALTIRKEFDFKKLFHLVNDSNSTIRKDVLFFLGKERSDSVALTIREYLEKQRYGELGNDHIVACYQALGGCCSDSMLPFLENILLSQPWNFMFGSGTAAHRQGAAEALAVLNSRGSQLILRKAAKSPFPHIRASCKNIR